MKDEARVTSVRVSVFTVPTDAPEADGTLAWDHTTMVLVELTSGSATGLGCTYADEATAQRPACICMRAVRCRAPFTWSSFTTMQESSACFSMASASLCRARCTMTCRGPAWD